MEVGGQHHAPAALPPGKTRYPLYRRLGRPQGRSGRLRKISPLPGFDPRTVQPVTSRYTDCAIPAPISQCRKLKKKVRLEWSITAHCSHYISCKLVECFKHYRERQTSSMEITYSLLFIFLEERK